ncbi:MAG: hypothetical protein J6Y16_09230 [Treponema sp.]|nr:hypothetical protein [Treponema sp.]
MTFKEINRWVKIAKGLEICGLLKSSDWKTLKILKPEYRDRLVQNVLDAVYMIGKNSRRW